MFTRWQWWSSRSRNAAAITSSPRIAPHSSNPLVESAPWTLALALTDELEEQGRPVPGHRRVAVLVHHQEGEVGKDPQPAQQLPPSCPPPRATRPNPSAVRKPPAGPARSFGSPGRSPGASSPPPEGPGNHLLLTLEQLQPVELAWRPKGGRTAAAEPERGPTTLLLTLFRRTPPMAIRLKREGRKTISRDGHHRRLGRSALHGPAHQGAPCVRKTFRPLPDNLDDFDSVEEILAWADKRREEIIAAEENREKRILAENRRRRQLRRERTPRYGQRRRGQRGNRQASS